jgi:hypothetical protein
MAEAWTSWDRTTRLSRRRVGGAIALGAVATRLVLLTVLLGVMAVSTARAADLTASSPEPTINFDDTDIGGVQWKIVGTSSAWRLTDVSSNYSPIYINSSSNASASLFVGPTGDVSLGNGAFTVTLNPRRLGLNTLSPQGDLHLRGLGTPTEDIFAGMGPDLASGPAFNFGYAGFSFGRSAGFFNVRPDASAVAPNPSLRFATANVQRMIITNIGYVGIGTSSPANPLQMESGARVTAGGVWTDASSREYKQDIEPLPAAAARAALEQLVPVTFAYRADPAERHVGFVAEDVPSLVATADRKGLSPMDIVGVLTRVLQEQQAALARLEAEVAELRRTSTGH